MIRKVKIQSDKKIWRKLLCLKEVGSSLHMLAPFMFNKKLEDYIS